MIGYPVLASEMMNRKFLFAQLNGELAASGCETQANRAARLSEEAADSIESLNKKYNALENGKWGGMMTVPPGFCAKYQERPPLRRFGGIGEEDFSSLRQDDFSHTPSARHRPRHGNPENSDR